MHICHVNLARGFSGGERQTLNLIQSLQVHGITQSAVVLKGAPLYDELVQRGVDVETVRHHLIGHSGSLRYKPDVLHAHDGKAVYWCAVQNLLRGMPYLVTRRVDNALKPKLMTKLAYSRAAKVVCLSRAIERQVKRLPVAVSTKRIPSSCSAFAVNPERVAQIRRDYQDKFLIGQVGKLLHHKGVHVTIAAARQMAKLYPDCHFLILGDGKDEAKLKQMAAGLSNVEFLGHRSDIGNYLAAIDLLVFPSLHEGLGSTILEAWQQGTPVIGSDAGGIPDIIEHETNGLLVTPDSDMALVAAIVKMKSEDAFRQRVTKAAGDALKQFSPDAIAEQYLQLYQRLFCETG